MKTLLSIAFAAVLSAACAWTTAQAEPPDEDRFDVPRVSREPIEAFGPERQPEVLLPADIIALPNETPQEALARALHGDETGDARAVEARSPTGGNACKGRK